MIALACPMCRGPLSVALDTADCRACQHAFRRLHGVWRLLRPQRVAAVEAFLADYTRIRLAEGRGSAVADFYRHLPDCPADHPLAWQWRMHRRTFACVRERVLPALGGPLRILDLGAGSGWLCNRLAQLGHAPCAIDLSCDPEDGLEAGRHYEAAWPRLQAEFDALPLGDSCVDAVVFNASLHYSTDYLVTLGEALRVLAPGGAIVVLETPVYKLEASGRRMAEERHARFLSLYGTRSDSLPSLEFLTWARIAELGRTLALEWRVVRPWYGLRWALRPLIARLQRRREPSRFPCLLARRC